MSHPPFTSHDAVTLGLIAPSESVTMEPLLQRCKQRIVQPGDIILVANEANTEAFVLLDGRLSVQLDPDNDSNAAQIEVGELVGEVSALTGNPTSAWVLASEVSRLLVIKRETLLELASGSHHFAVRMLRTVCSRLYSSNQKARSSAAESKDFRQKAFFDQLTRLKNRAWLNQHLPELLSNQLQCDTGLYTFMVDIDHFKRFNDTWGHAIGDLVLVEVGQALVSACRPNDHVIRLGGEEILVLADQISSQNQAEDLGERLRQSVSNRAIAVEGQENPLQVTISIGCTRHAPGESMDVTLERSDQALYRAKQAGRNRVETG